MSSWDSKEGPTCKICQLIQCGIDLWSANETPWLERKLANKGIPWLAPIVCAWIMRSFDIYGLNLFDKFHTHVINWQTTVTPPVRWWAINFDGLVRLWVASAKGLREIPWHPKTSGRVGETIRHGINCNNGHYYLFLFSSPLCVRRINFHKISMPGYW